MSQIYFISNQTIKDYSVLDNNIDEKSIKVAITAAQETMLQPLLGTNLYEKLANGVISGDLNQDYLQLLSNQIRKYLIAATVLKISINLLYRYTNSAVIKDSNSNSSAINAGELNAIRQEKESELKYYAQAITDYLLINQVKFPEYFALRLGDKNPEKDQSSNNFYYGED